MGLLQSDYSVIPSAPNKDLETFVDDIVFDNNGNVRIYTRPCTDNNSYFVLYRDNKLYTEISSILKIKECYKITYTSNWEDEKQNHCIVGISSCDIHREKIYFEKFIDASIFRETFVLYNELLTRERYPKKRFLLEKNKTIKLPGLYEIEYIRIGSDKFHEILKYE